MSPAVPATLQLTPTFFPFPFLSAVSTCTILDRDLPPPLPTTPHSLLSSLSCSCLGHNLPLSSDFFTSAPHATTAYQTSPITSQIFRSPHISLSNLASSPHLTLTSPPLASILFRVPRTHMCFKWLATRLEITPSGQSVLSALPTTLV
jgi:hypothetical protein